MTTGTEIIGACGIVLTLAGGFFVYTTRFAAKYGTELAIARRDSEKALSATEAHTVQLAITKDHAETALARSEEHSKALADTGARVAGMESTYRSIAANLEQLPLLRDDIGEMKESVAVLTSQMADIRPRRTASSKKRKR